MTPLRLAFFLPSLTGGGAQRVITTLSNALVSAGHNVDLYLTAAEGPFLTSVDSRVSIIEFGTKHTLYAVPALIQRLRERQPEVLVTASLNTLVAAHGALSWLRLRNDSVPSFCATIHSLPSFQARSADRLQAKGVLQAARFALRGVDATVAVSETVARDLSTFAGLTRDQISVFPNPFDIESIQENAQDDLCHEWLRHDIPVVLGVGRLKPEKNFPTFLRALGHLRRHRNIRGLVLGTGPYRASLQSLCRELGLTSTVEFLGFVDPPYPYMAQADLLALPSVAEAFGNVVVETLACSTPIIVSSKSGGPTEILEDVQGEYDPFVSPNTPRALARAMDRVLDQSIRGERLRRRACDFSLSPILEKYLSLFRTLASRPSDVARDPTRSR